MGWGWSHHTYHSQVDGRFNLVTNRHPASQYPSNQLSYMYSPEYNNLPPRPLTYSPTPTFWHPPTVVDKSNNAESGTHSLLDSDSAKARGSAGAKKPEAEPAKVEELAPPKPIDPPKPKEPPPSWLRPYLEDDKPSQEQGDLIELDSSPSDKSAYQLSAPNRYRR